MKKTDMKISIIIRAYNEEKYIQRLLDGIGEQRVSFGYEIILVDSGSTDNTVRIASKSEAKVINISSEKFSFGYSLNKGIAASSAEYCVFISAHCYPANEFWLDNLIRPFDDQTVAIVYGMQRGDHTSRYFEHQIFAKWFPEGGKGKRNSPFCNNANAAIRRSLWKRFKYNEMLTGLEDIDWAKNAISQGYSIYYDNDAVVIHLHNESYSKIFRRYEREAISMKVIYPQEVFTFLDFIKLFALNTLSDFIHAIQEGVFVKNIFDIPATRLSQFWGTYKGFNIRKAVSEDLRRKFYYPRKLAIFGSREKTG